MVRICRIIDRIVHSFETSADRIGRYSGGGIAIRCCVRPGHPILGRRSLCRETKQGRDTLPSFDMRQ